MCEKSNSADTNVSEEGAGGGALGTRAEMSLQPMEVHSGKDIHLQPVEDSTPEQVEAHKGGCDPMGSPSGGGSW